MTALLHPLIKALGQSRKAFLSPLSRYWVKPCCDNPQHLVNYTSRAYLPALGSSIFRLWDNIRDALYKKSCSNFWVVCTNRRLGIGLRLSDEAARVLSRLWGSDPVHPKPEV
jgi:hypothetical protein